MASIILSFVPTPSNAEVNKHFRHALYTTVYPQLLKQWKTFINAHREEVSHLAPRVVDLVNIPLPHTSPPLDFVIFHYPRDSETKKRALLDTAPAQTADNRSSPSEISARVKNLYEAIIQCSKERGLYSSIKQRNLEKVQLIPILQRLIANEDLALVNFFKALGSKLPEAKAKFAAIKDNDKLDTAGKACQFRQWMKEHRAQLAEITSLTLNDKGLTAIPKEIDYFTKLVILDLSNNRISSLPPELGQLKSLRKIVLSNNQLQSLPPQFADLKYLSVASLDNNHFSSFPLEICQLPRLTELSFAFNKIVSLPNKIENLKTMKTFDMAYNKISDLPEELYHLQQLTHVDLRGNPFTARPPFFKAVDVEV